ncbi:MAG: ABC transporter ATP-binding protein [Phycisphaerae bacterium]|jgi:Fe-S cluster assembly ATP-binding protein|nr:MAG: ABC transporter ATP-binding protein [Phycisphaerae bacterium]
MPVLEIKNLHAKVAGTDKLILKGVDLVMEKGQIHAIMGKNGSGKSTLCQVIAGRETYEVTEGDIIFNGQSILEMSPEERAREGVFLAFQYPVEIPGVSTSYFLKAAVNSIRKHRGEPELDAVQFIKLVKEKQKMLGIQESFMNRAVNEGFSGGEKKRNEVFQLAVINPLLGLLDETDSGLDIDALKVVAEGINKLHEQDAERSWLVVTHYQRLLNYIVPDVVHVMIDGRIVKTGDKALALELEEKGYDWVERESLAGV